MNCQDLVVDETSQRQPLEGLLEQLERLGTVRRSQALQAFLLEAILAIHQQVFMVSSHQPHMRWEGQLEGKEYSDNLQLVSTTINEISIENEVLVGSRAPIGMKQEQHVTKLTMNVAKHFARLRYLHDRGLCLQQLPNPTGENHEGVSVVRTEQEVQCVFLPLTINHVGFLLSNSLHHLLELTHHGSSSTRRATATSFRGRLGILRHSREAVNIGAAMKGDREEAQFATLAMLPLPLHAAPQSFADQHPPVRDCVLLPMHLTDTC
mmetsp:Transcript_35249/g.82216  ORF Transcript_35249/g.82216 Transcript_35249/m.82216 type:complete len:265 (+) Transcript_35249:598-1392(+)